jgi:hypothetical protein
MARPFARPKAGWWLVLGLSALLTNVATQAQAQKKPAADDGFSLDDEGEGAAKPAPTAAEAAAAGEGEQQLLSDEQAIAEEEAPDEKFRESTDPYEDPKKSYFFLGASWRYVMLPKFVLQWFLDEAPAITATGSFFGEFGYRKDGFQVIAQVGWMKWNFAGPFRAAGDPVEDTEWIDGKFNFLQGTAAVTWSTSFTDWFAIEYGVEGGFAGVVGDLTRSEAYHNDKGGWTACPTYAADPGWPPGVDRGMDSTTFCETPMNPPTDSASETGAHYNVKAPKGIANKGVPRAVPILGPRVALRFKPIHQLVLRVDIPLPLFPYGFVGGIAAQFGF